MVEWVESIWESGPWELELLLRLLAAAVFGALIGAEREFHGRSAGLRTHLLVSLGAAVAMVVSLHFGEVYKYSPSSIRVDPARVAYGVMGGVGFLGAGTIIRYEVGVRGLTTAASLWCTAAVGLAAGFGMYFVAGVTTAIVLFALYCMARLDRLIARRRPARFEATVPGDGRESTARVLQALRERGAHVKNVELVGNTDSSTARLTVRISLSADHPQKLLSLISISDDVPEIRDITVA